MYNLRPTGRMQPRMAGNAAQQTLQIYLKRYKIFLRLGVAVYLMCGPRHLFLLQCEAQSPKVGHPTIVQTFSGEGSPPPSPFTRDTSVPKRSDRVKAQVEAPGGKDSRGCALSQKVVLGTRGPSL